MELIFEFPETKDKYDIGFRCKCCNQLVKRYHRPLNSSMALTLIHLYKSGIRDWVHVEKHLLENKLPRSGDFHKLVHWQLLDKLEGDRPDGSSRNGYYKLNGKSLMFVEGKLKVPRIAVILNGKFQKFEGANVGITDCLNKKFDYSQLMNGNP